MSGAALVGIGDPVHQHIRLPSHEPGEPLRRNRALYFEQLFETLPFHLLGHVVLVLHGARPFLRRVGEGAEPVELRLFEEGEQLTKVAVGLARKAHQTGGANREIRDRPTQPAELLAQRLPPLRAPHAPEDPVRSVLDRHIDVRDDALLARDQVHQPLAQAGRIHVEEPVPRHGGLPQQRLQQVGEFGAARPEVTAVVAEVLGDEVDLLRPLRLELLRLVHQARERLGAVLAAHQRDRTEGAGVVAAFGDLEITHVRRVSEELPDAGVARDRVGNQPALGEGRHEVVQVGESEKEIDLRNFLLQLVLVPLDQAADGNDGPHGALRLEACG